MKENLKYASEMLKSIYNPISELRDSSDIVRTKRIIRVMRKFDILNRYDDEISFGMSYIFTRNLEVRALTQHLYNIYKFHSAIGDLIQGCCFFGCIINGKTEGEFVTMDSCIDEKDKVDKLIDEIFNKMDDIYERCNNHH